MGQQENKPRTMGQAWLGDGVGGKAGAGGMTDTAYTSEQPWTMDNRAIHSAGRFILLAVCVAHIINCAHTAKHRGALLIKLKQRHAPIYTETVSCHLDIYQGDNQRRPEI
eukprot:jgi/Mesvir1/10131/Mv26344-RA.1